eukprot:1149656-Pelagomonas_calceolata.AAC.3
MPGQSQLGEPVGRMCTKPPTRDSARAAGEVIILCMKVLAGRRGRDSLIPSTVRPLHAGPD